MPKVVAGKKTASRKIAKPKASRPQMPGYGLPASKKGLLPWKWAAERLAKSLQYWVATVRPEERPHVMPVWGLWMDNAFYFSTGSQSRKTKNLEANPECVICSQDSEEAVIVEGAAEKLRDVALIRDFLFRYEKKYKWDMSGMADGMLSLKEPVFFVRPRVAFGLWEKKFATSATRWKFSG
jgi:nitroimidazol reductase NimA-like FMN-containing flavoprotein (pyridoxamine 5'-phosphate oxidase superfamily)